MGLLACICKFTKVMSSCDDSAEMKDDEDSDGVSDEES